MRAPLQRPGGRSARVREAVVTAFLDMLVESGYSQMTFEGLAARAGVHKTTLYRRWGSREGLLLDVALSTARDSVPVPDSGSFEQDLRAFVHAVARNLQSPPAQAMLRAVVSEAMAELRVAEAARQFWEARFGAAREMVTRAIARGEVPPEADADGLIEALISPLYLRVLVTQGSLDEGSLTAHAAFVATRASASP